MAEKLTGDDLIAYGFKKLIEEIRELRGEITVFRSELSAMALDVSRVSNNSKDLLSVARNTYSKVNQLEHDAFMINDGIMASATSLNAIKANTFTAELNCIKMSQEARKGNTEDETERMGGV